MKFFELMRYSNNAVGAVFGYCTSDNYDEFVKAFNPDHIEEVDEAEYKEGMERLHRRFLYAVTGYPKPEFASLVQDSEGEL